MISNCNVILKLKPSKLVRIHGRMVRAMDCQSGDCGSMPGGRSIQFIKSINLLISNWFESMDEWLEQWTFTLEIAVRCPVLEVFNSLEL